jgi:tetraacyldisaccharide 4'-kinase
VPVVVARDRVAALRRLRLIAPEVDVVVSDDGLQHHRLPRTVQVIVFDERGVGNGLRLPAGPLREALPDSLPSSTLVVYNAATPSTPLPGWIGRRRLAGPLPLADWLAGARRENGWPALQGRPLCAVAGTAVPERFFAMLEAQGLTIHRLPLADHHPFDPLPWPVGSPEVIVTEKDAVKIESARLGATRVWVVPLDFDIEPAFAAALTARLPPRTPR